MKIFLTTEAKLDIKEASYWYEEKEKGLGRRFTTVIREEIAFISKNPESIALRYKEIHTCVVSVFPYMIHYYIDNNRLVIVGILHTSLSPNKWR